MPFVKTLRELLAEITLQLEPSSDTASLDAQVLVAHKLGKPRAWVLAHPEFQISPEQHAQISQAMERLRNGEPLPYVIGHWEFYGKDFILTPDVLIPRPDTELLVEESIRWLKQHPTQRQAIDVGTGSGCIGISLAAAIPDLHLVLTDISGSALGVAQKNAQKHAVAGRLEFIQANLLEGITGHFDLICANLPYIPTDMLKSLPVAICEPVLALDGGKDGMDLTSQLLEQARQRLKPGGVIFLEIEALQGNEIHMLAEKLYPAARINVIKSLAGWDRCVVIERSSYLIHICQREEWQQAQKYGSFQDESLRQSGFIHCSTPEQVLEVANRFYRDVPDLVLLWLNPNQLPATIRWEPADGQLFPHVYGPINLQAVVSITSLCCDDDRTFRTIEFPG